jgi:formylglycine-generating enzyme required for sulfatase activity
VIRGGSWYEDPPWKLRSAARTCDYAANRAGFGFRVARTLNP